MSIDSIVNLTAGKIGELLAEEARFLYGVEDQVGRLQKELRMMNSYLIDMEAMEEGGDERSRTTIKEIRKIAYDAEDVIQSYILEASSSADKKEGFLKRYLCFCSSLPRTHQVGSEIEAIIESINKTIERWKRYDVENGVRTNAGERSQRSRERIRPIAYAHNNEEYVVGLHEDINKLIGLLTDDDTKIQVLSIVGMGGSGKTTLARKLYNHERVKKHFDCIAWVSVSQQWVAQKILLDLFRNVGGETKEIDEAVVSIEVLGGKLHLYLEGKRYLIVLDDVWEEKVLKIILPALPLGSSSDNGKKLILTTRKQKVVDYPDLKPFTHTHNPRRLDKEESWELFRKIAPIDSMDINANLQALGKEMLDKCGGLPLAVIALAGILHEKKTLEEWEKVRKAVSSRIMEDGKGTHLYGPVNQMLVLSYYDMPSQLKPCFLYLACYPEGQEISVQVLLNLWIAEGFITSDNEGDTLEDVAQQYLDELINRCVVQIARKNYEGKVKAIQTHDLVRDLCIKKAKEQDFLYIFTSKSPCSNTMETHLRRAAVYSYDRMYVPFPTKSQHLRSLVYEAGYKIEYNQDLSLEAIHQNFKLLRVLLLVGISISNSSLPEGIGSLIHLRYLGLRWTDIRELPSSIGNLRNLLTLDYRNYGEGVIRIPDVLWKIEGLRHLYLPRGVAAVETLKLHTLTNLQKLWMGIGGNWMLEELPRLSASVQKLTIFRITSKKQLEAAFRCPSIGLDGLHSFELNWAVRGSSKEGDDEEVVVKVENLEPIIHSQHLRKLRLYGRIEDRLGCIQFPTSIYKLVLVRTWLEEEAALVAIGKLPQLISLELSHHAYRGSKWPCSAGEFRRLKELTVYSLPNLEEWSIERGAMPRLSKVIVSSCGKLRKLPEGLKFISTLQEVQLKGMGYELEERVKGEDAHTIQHVPLVHFIR